MTNWILGARPFTKPVQHHRQRGFTLIELMMTVVLVAVGVALAIPSYRGMVEKRQLTNAAEQLVSFVNVTQSIASRTNEVVTVSFNQDDPDDWCIGATMGNDACDCEETNPAESDYCEIDSQLFVLNESLASDAELMQSIDGNGSYSIDPVRGLFTDVNDFLTMEMQTKSGDYRLNLMVSATGRVILCSKDSNHSIPGYEVCPAEEIDS